MRFCGSEIYEMKTSQNIVFKLNQEIKIPQKKKRQKQKL